MRTVGRSLLSVMKPLMISFVATNLYGFSTRSKNHHVEHKGKEKTTYEARRGERTKDKRKRLRKSIVKESACTLADCIWTQKKRLFKSCNLSFLCSVLMSDRRRTPEDMLGMPYYHVAY